MHSSNPYLELPHTVRSRAGMTFPGETTSIRVAIPKSANIAVSPILLIITFSGRMSW